MADPDVTVARAHRATESRTAGPLAVEPLADTRQSRLAIAFVRVGVALLWVQNSSWKTPPKFGANGNSVSGLRRFTGYAVEHPVLAPFTWLVKHVVLPNFTLFGWLTLFTEASIGAFLLIGLATRFWAAVGILQTSAITLSVLHAPNEWHWTYFLMFLAHIALLALAAGRAYGLDGVLRPQWRASGSRSAALLMRVS